MDAFALGARSHGFLIHRTAGIKKKMKSFSAWSRAGSEFLTKEIFPGLTPYVRWAKTPLGSLGLAGAASALCGSFLHQQGFVVLVAIGAVTILGLVWPWLNVCELGGSLSFTRSRCREGDQVSALLTLRNRAPWGAWGVAVECGRGNNDSGPDDDLRTGLAYAPGWCSTERTFDFIPRCRLLSQAPPADRLRVPLRPLERNTASRRRDAGPRVAPNLRHQADPRCSCRPL